jgi:hypothetical protein
MSVDPKITPEETAELQALYAELPSAIAEAAEAAAAARAEQLAGRKRESAQDGDEKVDTIIRRICQLTEPPAE